MSKKNKIGSVEFVQTGFAVGSNTIKGQTDGHIDFKLMTIDPEMNIKLNDNRVSTRDGFLKVQKQQNIMDGSNYIQKDNV